MIGTHPEKVRPWFPFETDSLRVTGLGPELSPAVPCIDTLIRDQPRGSQPAQSR